MIKLLKLLSKNYSNIEFTSAKFNLLSLPHKTVYKFIEGKSSYIGTFEISGFICACYLNKKPNKSKGHKDIVLLYKLNNELIVSGISLTDFEKYRYVTVLECLNCRDLIYSIYRNDYRTCKCGESSIDGGYDYIRVIGSNNKLFTVDVLTTKIIGVKDGN